MLAAAHAASSNLELRLPLGFAVETIITGLDLPTAIAWTPDGRLFIAEKAGRVRVVRNGALLPNDFINISDQVNSHWDRGLIGLAVHPNFPSRPYVYLLFTYDPPGVEKNGTGARVCRLMRVSAHPLDSNVALPGSEVVLLGKNGTRETLGNEHDPNDVLHPSCARDGVSVPDCLPSDTPYHSVGDVRFAPDGSLFVSNGEASSWEFPDPRSLRAQDVDSLAGKLLRIDPDTGLGLSMNPFFDGDPTSNRSKVWSYGLRTPFRLAIDPVTDEPVEPVVGDVGQSDWEEINAGRGANFGWPCYEGYERHTRFEIDPIVGLACAALYAHGQSAVTWPKHAYEHITGHSITLGEFYTGSTYPTEYHGALFFADYVFNWIKYIRFDDSGYGVVHDFAENAATGYSGIVDFAIGPEGDLYYVVLDPYGAGGEVRAIRYVGENMSPVAVIEAAPTDGSTPLLVHFDGRGSYGSYDSDEQPLNYFWALGDGAMSTAPALDHMYTMTGTYTATLTVTDPLGKSAQADVMIVVGNHRPRITFTAPAADHRFNANDEIHFTAVVTDVEDGPIPDAQVSWQALLHHDDHVHPDLGEGLGPAGVVNATDHGDDIRIEVCVRATDSGGLTGKGCRIFLPRLTTYTFDSQPRGLRLSYDGRVYSTPFAIQAVIHGERTISAPTIQSGCIFTGWDDGSPQTRRFVVSAEPITLTARYEQCMSWLPIVAR